MSTSPVNRTSAEQKQQSREAARKRFGTPKVLRDLLREKCRIRLREARQCEFHRTRNLFETISVNEILRQELSELEKDVELQLVIFEEVKAEANEWFAEQLEEEENYLIEVGDSEELICPVCQKSSIRLMPEFSHYACICGARFRYPGTITELRAALEERVNEHGENCESSLLFFVDSYVFGGGCGRYILSCMCDCCDYFASF